MFGFLLLLGCKKEPKYDTIFPEEYFPAYPGSYWVYTNGVTKTTEAYYRLHTVNSEDVYVPVYDGEIVNGYKVGNKEIINFNGYPWQVGEFDGMEIYREIVDQDTSLRIIQYPYNDSIHCDTLFENVTSIPVDTIINLIEVDDCDGYFDCDTALINCNNPHSCDTLYYALIEEIIYYDTAFIDTILYDCDSITMYNNVIVVKEYVSSLDELDCWFYKEYYAKDVGLVKREVAGCSDSTSYITEFELVKYEINK